MLNNIQHTKQKHMDNEKKIYKTKKYKQKKKNIKDTKYNQTL